MGELTICASTAGALAGLAGNPADVILVRMITDSAKPPAQQQHYRNAAHGLYRMVGSEGMGALFLGLVPNVVRSIIMNSSQLVSYDMFKEMLVGFGMGDGIPLHFSASALAGTFATTVCSPADVVKSRVMHSSDLSVMQVLSTSFKNEGAMFLFRGWLPAWSKSTTRSRGERTEKKREEELTASSPHAQHNLHVRLPRAVEACCRHCARAAHRRHRVRYPQVK